MNRKKKIISLMLTMALAVSLVSTSAFAGQEEAGAVEEIIEEIELSIEETEPSIEVLEPEEVIETSEEIIEIIIDEDDAANEEKESELESESEENTEEETIEEIAVLSDDEAAALMYEQYPDGIGLGEAVQDDGYEYSILLYGSEENPVKPNVTYHSQKEISNFINALDMESGFAASWAEEPSLTPPYSEGILSEDYAKGALNVLNAVRFVAGIPANVTLNSTYSEMCQAGMLLNRLNSSLSHFPTQPEGVSDELYQKGRSGASSSNIAWGYSSLGYAIIGGWMFDGRDSNLEKLGHRRWILNPSMGATGFGQVGTFSAMYAFDRTGSPNYSGVVWPAQNTPSAMVSAPDSYPWSISMGMMVQDATVKVKYLNTGKTYTFGSGTSDGYFNINNAGYGQTGCIIFVPTNLGFSFDPGNSYYVTVNGSYTDGTAFSMEYTVNFFDLDNPKSSEVFIDGESERELVNGSTLQLEATVIPALKESEVLTWSSSNENVATVDSNGLVTAHTYGTAKITVRTPEDASASVTIHTKFTDMTNSTDSFYKAIYWAADNGIVNGYSNGNFGHGDSCTRKQFAIMLYRYAGKPAVSGDMLFVDCHGFGTKTDSYKAIVWASQLGIIKGYDDQTFRPDMPVTRKQTMIMLYRYAGKPAVSGEMSFEDCQTYGKGSDTYKAILWGTQNSITKGTNGGVTFSPDDNCLRRQIALFLYRFDKIIN